MAYITELSTVRQTFAVSRFRAPKHAMSERWLGDSVKVEVEGAGVLVMVTAGCYTSCEVGLMDRHL